MMGNTAKRGYRKRPVNFFHRLNCVESLCSTTTLSIFRIKEIMGNIWHYSQGKLILTSESFFTTKKKKKVSDKFDKSLVRLFSLWSDEQQNNMLGPSLDASDILSFTPDSKFLVPINKQMKLLFYLTIEIDPSQRDNFQCQKIPL